MYIIIEQHFLRTGLETLKYTWWFKNEKDEISVKQKTIHSNYDMAVEARLFLEENPKAKFLFKDFSGQKLTLKQIMKHELIE